MSTSPHRHRSPDPGRNHRLTPATGSGRARVTRRVVRLRADDGVTLVEVLVASVILLVTMIPMGMLLTSASSAAVNTRQRQAALQLADSWVEILANSQPPTRSDGSVHTYDPHTPVAPPGTVAPPSTLAGTTYTVSADYIETLVNANGQSDFCSAGQPPDPSHPGVIQLEVTVSWGPAPQHSLLLTTDINYPKPGLQTEGFLAVSLTNGGGPDVLGNPALVRLQAIPVTITQVSGTPALVPSSFTAFADKNGCIFVQVPPGNYTVSDSQPTAGTPSTFAGYTGTPPFVTTTGATSQQKLNQTVTVASEQTVQLDAFDEGITGTVTYGGASAVDASVQCPAAAGLICVSTGSGPTGAVATWGDAGSTWSSTNLAAGTHVNQVACTTASPATCVGVGYGPGGALIMSTPSDLSSVTSDTVPAGVTDLTQVVCPSDRACWALGTSTTGPVLLAGEVSTSGDVWSRINPPGITFTALDSIACPTADTCELAYAGPGATPGVLRLDGDPAALGGNPAWMPTITSDVLPSVVTGLGAVACPSDGTCLAIATGDTAGPTDPTVIAAPIAGSGPSTWASESSFPTGATTLTGMTCTSVACLAIGSVTGSSVVSPAVWADDLTSSSDSWSQVNTLPNSVTGVTSVACGAPASGDAADCVVGAITPSLTSTGQLLEGSLTNGSWAWNFVSQPAGVVVQYVVGVACPPITSSTDTCAATAATASGPIVLTSGTGPSGGWTTSTPAVLAGGIVTGIPLETAPSGTSSWTTQVAAGQPSNTSLLPNVLYPQAGGYTLVAGDCPIEATSSPTTTSASNTTLDAPPGGVASATVPLGLLPLQLVDSTGAPVGGATVTLTTPACPVGSDAYNLPVTDAAGMTATSVPYGTYTYTVTLGGSATAHTSTEITVGSDSIQVTTGPTGSATTTSTFLPGTVQVSA